jgi:6-phosphogluconolactonase
MTRAFVLVGHGNPSGDVQIWSFDRETGALAPHATVPTGSSTSYLAFAPGGRFAYTTQNRSNRVTAFAVDAAAGTLRKLGDAAVPAASGEAEAGPAYASVDAHGRFLLVANYRGHNAVVFQLGDDGGIGPVVADVTPGKHAHCVVLSHDNRFAFVPCLGADRVAQFHFDETTGALAPNDPPAVPSARGAGPRHLAFAPDGARAYLINELDATLTAYDYHRAHGHLTPHATVPTLPEDYDGRRWAADIHVHPNGRFVYLSNRAHDSLGVFDAHSLALVQRIACGGKSPRNFALSPEGRFLLVANQDSGNLVCFSVDERSGRLEPRGEVTVAPSPYFVKIMG